MRGVEGVIARPRHVRAGRRHRLCRARTVAAAVAALTLAGCDGFYRQEANHRTVEAFAPTPGPSDTDAMAAAPAAELDAFIAVLRRDTPEVAEARSRLAAAEAQVRERRRTLWPEVRLVAEGVTTEQRIRSTTNPSFSPDQDATSRENYESTLTISQPILDAPAMAELRVAEAQRDQRAGDLEEAEQAITERALDTYLGAVEAQERFRLARAETAFFTELVEAEDSRVAAGEMRAAEAVGARADLVRARTSAISAAQDFLARRGELCRLAAGRICPRIGSVTLAAALPRPAPLTEEERLRIADSPAQQALLSSLEVANLEIDRALSERLPRVSLRLEAERRRQEGDTVFTASSEVDELRAGLYLDWTIYSSGRVTAARDRRIAAAQAAVERIRSDRNLKLDDLEAAETALLGQWRNDAALRELVALRREAVSQARRERDAGEATNLVVRQLELELTRNEVGLSAVRRNYLRALVARHRATGTLDADVVATVRDLTGAQRVSDNRIAAVLRR
jgi:outer membrane protein TolC